MFQKNTTIESSRGSVQKAVEAQLPLSADCVTCLPFGHQVAILHFRALEPDVGAGLHHGSLDDAHEAAVHLPHLLSDKGARAVKPSSRKPPGTLRHRPQPLTP